MYGDEMMYGKIASICRNLEYMRDAMRRIRWIEFGENCNFDNDGEAIRAMEKRDSALAEIHKKMNIFCGSLRDNLYQMIKDYYDVHGETETRQLLSGLRQWHPWSYKEYSETVSILQEKMNMSF